MITADSTQRDTPGGPRRTAFRLVVKTGPERGQELWVREETPGALRVGSSRACDLVLADRKVSRRHFAVECSGGKLRLSDLRSTNGTSVNGVGVEIALLGGGETIRVGDVTLDVEAHADTSSPRVPAVRGLGRLVGASLAMRRLYPAIERLAASDLTAVIEGETGTGKELLAEVIHETSRRRAGPFVVVDAQAFGADALGDVLAGAFEEARGGTVFIDDVAEMPLPVQSRFYRMLERTMPSPPRASSDVDVRLLVGTRRDLDREVEDGNFREDLFYRLSVCRLELPPLRSREDDVALLVEHFWRQLDPSGSSPPPDLHFDEKQPWPGNVRELKNLVTRRFVLGAPLLKVERRLEPAAPEAILESIVENDLSFPEAKERALAAFERLYVTRLLERHRGDVAKAAAVSGLARRYFHKLKARALPDR